MTQAKGIYSMAISARATLNLHSLNNEGGEGNQTQTRMVNVIGEDGDMHSVNAISGDMFKHIQAEHLHRLAVAGGLPLSDGARTFNANRVNMDVDAGNSLGQRIAAAPNDPQKLDVILQSCAVTDMEGILITAGGQSLPRKSVVEFGWVVGIPDKVETDTFLHVKYASDRSTGARASATTEAGREANIGQALFHRPASSGVYAIVVNLELARIGFNDIAQTYAISAEERAKRTRVLLESVLYTFIEPAGAMRSTQNPHIVNVEGVIAVSRDVVPAPCLSPLKGSFATDLEQIRDSINILRPGAIETIRFTSTGELAQQMASLIPTAIPFELSLN
jgi:CRISPR-associated protein Cst2